MSGCIGGPIKRKPAVSLVIECLSWPSFFLPRAGYRVRDQSGEREREEIIAG